MENLILDYCSEAEYLDDRCDYNFDNLDTYSSEEKQLYVIARSHCFSKKDIGKYVVVQNTRRNKNIVSKLYLVDRTKTKQMWWSPASIYAMIFEKKSAAEYQAKKYKYNKVRIKQITQEMADIEYFINNYTE